MDHLGVDKGEKLYRLKLKEVLSLFFPISKQTPDFNATTKQNEPKKKKKMVGRLIKPHCRIPILGTPNKNTYFTKSLF